MPQDTPQPHQPQSTTPTAPDIPTFRTNIPQKSFNKLIPVVIILAVLALAGLGTSIFFGIKSSNQSSEISDLKTQISNQNPTVVIDDEEISKTPSTPTDQPNVVTKADILAEVPHNLIIKDNDIAYSIRDHSYRDDPYYAMEYSWSFYSNSGGITIRWDTIDPSLNTNNKTGNENINDFGPTTGHVIDFVFSQFGNGFGDETFLFLMDDGTIEYVPLYPALQDGNFRSRGKLGDIDDIIKFYKVNANNPYGSGGYLTVLAQRADGTFYDLSQLVHANNNY